MASATFRWLGHSGFLVRDDSTGTKVLVDPWFEGNPAGKGRESLGRADLLLVTHDHFDHASDVPSLAKETGALVVAIFEIAQDLAAKGLPPERILNGGGGMNIGGTVEAAGCAVTMTEARHSCNLGAPAGYVVRLPSGFTFYHSGDTGIFPGMSLIGDLYPIDVALLPIGSVFTMDWRQAALAVSLLRPKAVVPMHYRTFPILEQTADRFVAEVERQAPGTKVVVVDPGEEATIEAEGLPRGAVGAAPGD
jgi:L-ascorbate metabolism protein UlaG (beta-lactamase superfamily)